MLFRPGVASALDATETTDSRDVGAGVSDGRSEGQEIALDRTGGSRRDDTCAGAFSDVTGRALGGSLEARRLRQVMHDAPFCFAVAAFLPDVEIVLRW